MARSSAFAQLVGIARDILAAKKRGVDVATLRSERSGLSRRGFLGAAGATAATLLLPKVARAAGAPDPRIAVIGAGISGLTAALALADANLTANLTVYESKNRVGGRMFSNTPMIGGTSYWDDNQVTEWCGELIDTGHTTIRMLAQRYNLVVDDIVAAEPTPSNPVYRFDNTYYTIDELLNDFPPVLNQILIDSAAAIPDTKSDGTNNDDGTVLYNAITDAGVVLDNLSVFEWIEQKVPGGHTSKLGKLLDAAYASEYGADTAEQSSLNLVLLLSGLPCDVPYNTFGSSDERSHIEGGNQLLPLAIAADLTNRLGPDVIQLNNRLTRIALNNDNTIALTFEVTNAGRTTEIPITADAVILTLPFAVLADTVDFSGAGFDALKTRAITELGRGLCSKLQLQFTSRLWNKSGPWGIDNGEETYSDNGDQCSWHVTRGQPGTSGIINGYTGGTPTRLRANTVTTPFGLTSVGTDGASIATLASTFLGQLEQIFPGITPLYNGQATLSLPHLDPDFRLAYSFWAVGQYQAFAGYERVPQGNIFFAGEHTSVNFQGFMEGGAAEGARAATEVIAAAAANAFTPPPTNDGGCCDAGTSSPASSILPIAAVAVGLGLVKR